jgi:Na+(H+)/acetate symporter ActP
MKTWIIILTIVYVVLKIVQTLLANYIRNDRTERIKYYYTEGGTLLGFVHGLVYLLSLLALSAAVILVIILLIGKL